MSGGPGRFPTTSWMLVHSATKPDARRSALGLLCETYWPPVYAYLCRYVSNPDAAKDLTQAFFVRLLEKRNLAGGFEQGQGRFRWYLLACVKHFAANDRERARALKRGGGQQAFHLELHSPEALAFLLDTTSSPERLFERRWALMMLDRALLSVRRRYEALGQRQQFERLKEFLVEPGGYKEAGADLEMSESALKMAVLRLRRRFAEALRAEIALTVTDAADVEDEMTCLLRVLRGQR